MKLSRNSIVIITIALGSVLPSLWIRRKNTDFWKTCNTKEMQKKTNKHLENMSKSIVKIKGLGLVEIVPDRVQIKIHIEELFDNTTDAYKNW